MPTPASQAAIALSAELAGTALLHSVWVATAVASVVALVFQARSNLSHRARHTILLAALVLVAVAPPVLALAQHWTVPSHVAKVSVGGATEVVTGRRSGVPQARTPVVRLAEHRRDNSVNQEGVAAMLSTLLAHAVAAARTVRPFALTAWSVGALGWVAVLILAGRGMSRLVREGREAPADVQTRARRLGRRLRLRAVPMVRVHPRLDEPCVCGAFRLAVFLPERWLSAASAGALDAVLAHELAHVRRRDPWVNLVQRLVEVGLFFHPGWHWLSRSLRHQREHLADTLAVRVTGDPVALAWALESVARDRLTRRAQRPFAEALGGQRMSLLTRIQELIGMKPIDPSPRYWPVVALPAAAAFALVASAAGRAQEPQLPAPAPAAAPGLAPMVPPPNAMSADSDRQISYAVRVLTFPASSGLRIVGPVEVLKGGPKAQGLVLAPEGLNALLKQVHDNPAAHEMRAPKVTCFEFMHATIVYPMDKPSAPDVQTAPNAPPRKPDQVAQGRLTVHAIGAVTSRGTRISVDVIEAKAPPAREEQTNPSRPPLPSETQCWVTCDLADGSSLVANLGQSERMIEGQPKTVWCLVVVTPRRIVFEPDGGPDAAAEPGVDRMPLVPWVLPFPVRGTAPAVNAGRAG